MDDPNIAEILSEDGRVRFRYARYLSADGTQWVRHGRFEAYHINGRLSSEGSFVHGVEQKLFRLAPIVSFQVAFAFNAIDAVFQTPRANLRCGPGSQFEGPAKRGVDRNH